VLVVTLASSSSGNCALVSGGGQNILIDAGISYRRIVSSLNALGVGPRDISAVLITHTHSDHIGGLPTLTKYISPRIFCGRGTDVTLERSIRPGGEITRLDCGADLYIGELKITPFKTSHDSPGSVGYSITSERGRFVYCTDLGIVTPEVEAAALGADAAVIESNHDLRMLQTGPYPQFLKRRIASDVGHLSNDTSAAFAGRLADSGTRRLVLAHLSKENNTPEAAYSACTDSLRKRGAERDVTVRVAPHDCIGEALIL
jgi:phosphoribosyl 1,2-cyclic phosphodiesterase